MPENNDQDLQATPEVENEGNETPMEQGEQEQSDTTPEQTEQDVNQEEAPEEEQITPKQAYDLARVSQKGLTQTFQRLARLEEQLQGWSQGTRGDAPRETSQSEPQTWEEMKRDLVNTIEQQEAMRQQAKIRADQALHSRVQNELEELRMNGRIVDEKDQNELVAYAMKHKIGNLLEASDRLEELKQARREGMKLSAKAEVRQKTAKNVGTSQKASEEKGQGVPYAEIAQKSFFDL